MAKFALRLQARSLRKEGFSISEICKKLDVSKSTMSVWCLDVQLSPKQKEVLIERSRKAGHLGRIKGSETNRRRRLDRIEYFQKEAVKKLANLTDKERLVAGLALYWAEGSKKKGKLSITNSDPALIKFFAYWYVHSFGIDKRDFHPRVMINAIHEPRKDKVVKFWAKLLDIAPAQFANTVLIQNIPKKVYENYEEYYGVLSLEIRRGTDKKYELLGLIDALKKL